MTKQRDDTPNDTQVDWGVEVTLAEEIMLIVMGLLLSIAVVLHSMTWA